MTKSGIFILCLLVFLGCEFVYVSFAKYPSEFAQFESQKVIVQGYVCSDPLKGANNTQNFELCLEQKYSQKILVSTFSRDNYFYGDNLYAIGKLQAPHSSGVFDYQKYLKSKNIYAEMYSPQAFVISSGRHNPVIYYALRFKHFVYARFFKYLSKEKAALLVALIIGQKDLLDQSVVAAFNIVGLAHLIAVSGYILTLTLAFSAYLKIYIGKTNSLLLCLAIAIIYVIMADFAAGVIRAAIMSAIYVLSKTTGRQYNLAPALLLTAAILVALNPLIIRYDLGFIYSFLSIAGIIYFVPVLNQLLKFVPQTLGIRNIICVTLAAQLITIPISIYYFQQLSLVAPLTNLLVIPIVEICLVLGYMLCLPLIGFVAAQALTVPLNYILVIVSGFAAFKYSALLVTISATQMLALYALEGAVYWSAYRLLKPAILFDKML